MFRRLSRGIELLFGLVPFSVTLLRFLHYPWLLPALHMSGIHFPGISILRPRSLPSLPSLGCLTHDLILFLFIYVHKTLLIRREDVVSLFLGLCAALPASPLSIVYYTCRSQDHQFSLQAISAEPTPLVFFFLKFHPSLFITFYSNFCGLKL